MAARVFYAHYADPTFVDPPCPGERRLGPFLTLDEAEAQVANDIAHGHLAEDAFLGIYDSEQSIERAHAMQRAYDKHQPDPDPWGDDRFDPRGRRGGKHATSAAKVVRRARKQQAAMHDDRARAIEDQRQTLQQLLPDGIDADEMLRNAKRMGL